jgi:hypothetical protein
MRGLRLGLWWGGKGFEGCVLMIKVVKKMRMFLFAFQGAIIYLLD